MRDEREIVTLWLEASQRLCARIARALVMCAVAALLVCAPRNAASADEAEASATRYSIAVFLNSPADGCYDSGGVRAVQHFVKRRINSLNRLPEFRDRRLRVDFYDDHDDAKAAVANVKKALDDPATLAMVGLSGSNRSKAVFTELGDQIGAKAIPFFTDLSVTGIFEPYGNVYTMRPSQENERIPLISKFLADGKFQRPAYVGIADNVASSELLKGLSDIRDTPPLAVAQELTVKDGALDETEAAGVLKDLKATDADLIMVMLGTKPVDQFMTLAAAAGVHAPLLLMTDNDKSLTSDAASAYGARLYQLAWQTLPDIYNVRVREQMLSDRRGPWIFEDRPVKSAPGWSDGKCKKPDDDKPLRQLDAINLKAIGRGTRYSDMVGIVGDIVKVLPSDTPLVTLRARVLEGLKTTYAEGRGIFRGEFDNWSFHPLSRTASQTPAILMRPRMSDRVRLAPRQYMKLRSDALRPIQTLYMDVDMTRIFRVDDNEKSFFAEFFLTLNSAENFDIANIDFTNAFLDAGGSGQNITIAELHKGEADGVYPEGIQVYKVTGKFMMRPDFSRYPFDTQLFTIAMKPKSGDSAFIVQPPSERQRDRSAETDGWLVQDQYVGYDKDYIPITDGRTDTRSVVPFYKVNFSWVMSREATDYYLRVVVPLAFILLVAYLSIYIPREHFEAVVTIQVTALLSAVALYLSIPKVGSDAQTVSDRIFLFYYMAVSFMITVSVLRVNTLMRRFPKLDIVFRLLHIIGIPLMVLAMGYFVVLRSDSSAVPSWQSGAEVADAARP
jgi:hypothetical protein